MVDVAWAIQVQNKDSDAWCWITPGGFALRDWTKRRLWDKRGFAEHETLAWHELKWKTRIVKVTRRALPLLSNDRDSQEKA